MTKLISQKYVERDGYRMAHTVTALDNGIILMSHTGHQGAVVEARVHLTRDEARALRDLLTDAIEAYRPIDLSNIHPVMAEAIAPVLGAA